MCSLKEFLQEYPNYEAQLKSHNLNVDNPNLLVVEMNLGD